MEAFQKQNVSPAAKSFWCGQMILKQTLRFHWKKILSYGNKMTASCTQLLDSVLKSPGEDNTRTKTTVTNKEEYIALKVESDWLSTDQKDLSNRIRLETINVRTFSKKVCSFVHKKYIEILYCTYASKVASEKDPAFRQTS